VTDAQFREVGASSSAMTPLSVIFSTTNGVIARVYIYHWSQELFLLHTISVFAAQHDVFNCYITTVTSEDSLLSYMK
jgi:hypothetical protein